MSEKEIQNPKVKIQNQSGFYEITTEPLDVGAIARRIVPAGCGAIVTLDGFVRQFTRGRETEYLVYEAYEPMALKELEKLIARAHDEFEIENVTIVHRLGRLEIGETSVVISVGAAHRRAAFEACEWLIKELKRTVPIWKKEVYADGETWIEGDSALQGEVRN
ncbi:MAG TPA: molybdenum cofactor biosynthesis protein MoaE [Pyrinomonadaceae bacterium]|jgi:molybdopterin synthase catalytic subunit